VDDVVVVTTVSIRNPARFDRSRQPRAANPGRVGRHLYR